MLIIENPMFNAMQTSHNFLDKWIHIKSLWFEYIYLFAKWNELFYLTR